MIALPLFASLVIVLNDGEVATLLSVSDQPSKNKKRPPWSKPPRLGNLNVEALHTNKEERRFRISVKGAKPESTIFKIRYEKGPTKHSSTWFGTAGPGESLRIVRVAGDGQVSIRGTIRVASGTLRFAADAKGKLTAYPLDPGFKVPPAAEPVVPKPKPERKKSVKEVSAKTGPSMSKKTLSVMIVYTTKAKDDAGGKQEILADAIEAFLEMRDALKMSGVKRDLKLAAIREVGYDESVPSGTGGCARYEFHLNRARDGMGSLAKVPQWRNKHKADLVCLVVADLECRGVAYLMTKANRPSFAPSAYSVVGRAYLTVFHDFCHELGHNFGCCHEGQPMTAAVAVDAHPHAFGGKSGKKYRTILNSSAPSKRIMRFSNPLILFDFVATGVDGKKDNARVITETGCDIMGYR